MATPDGRAGAAAAGIVAPAGVAPPLRDYWACNRCGWQADYEIWCVPNHLTPGGELCGCPHFNKNNGPGQRREGCGCHGTVSCLTPENAAARKAAQSRADAPPSGRDVDIWACEACGWRCSRLAGHGPPDAVGGHPSMRGVLGTCQCRVFWRVKE